MAVAGLCPRWSGVALGGMLAFAAATPVAGGEPQRWVDEHGEVHYTDAPPPESVRHPVEQPEDEAEVMAREQAKREAEERAKQDRMLQRSYSSVEDIERTRDRRLEAVEGRIELAEHRVKQARKQLGRYVELLANLPEDDENRAEMEAQRKEAFDRLERRRHELGELRLKRDRIEQRFAGEIARFRELTAEHE